MSWKNKYPIVPDKEPKFSITDTLTVVGRTPLAGEEAIVVSIWPNQKTVHYTMRLKNGKETDVNETMLRKES